MDFIEINGMEFFSYIGHYAEEKIIETKFNVDLRISTDLSKAEISDQLPDAINYVEIYSLVKNEMSVKCNLVENVTKRITDKLLEKFPTISALEIKISKLNPKIGGNVKDFSIVKKIKR